VIRLGTRDPLGVLPGVGTNDTQPLEAPDVDVHWTRREELFGSLELEQVEQVLGQESAALDTGHIYLVDGAPHASTSRPRLRFVARICACSMRTWTVAMYPGLPRINPPGRFTFVFHTFDSIARCAASVTNLLVRTRTRAISGGMYVWSSAPWRNLALAKHIMPRGPTWQSTRTRRTS
jgi:hypothetical protein